MAKIKKSDDSQNDLDFEIHFLEGVVRESPDFAEALINLGDLYTKKGLFDKGLDVDRKLVCLRPDDPVVWYNLACSYSLVNDLERSFDAMRSAIAKGYEDMNFLEQDADLVNLRQYPAFEKFFAEIKSKVL